MSQNLNESTKTAAKNGEQPTKATPAPSESSSFLGGGPKFNQAGLNTPMPGEKTADADKVLPFGGPRVWAGVVVILLLIGFLWFYVGNGSLGITQTSGAHQGIDPNDRPDVNADQPAQN